MSPSLLQVQAGEEGKRDEHLGIWQRVILHCICLSRSPCPYLSQLLGCGGTTRVESQLK